MKYTAILYLLGAVFDGAHNSANNSIQTNINIQNPGYESYIEEDAYIYDQNSTNDGFLSFSGEGIIGKFFEGIFNIIAMVFSGVSITIMIMFMVCIMIVTFILRAIIYNPIIVGKNNFFMGIREGERNVGDIFVLFSKSKFIKPAFTMFFVDLFTFLWTLLLVVPGIIKSYEYRMIQYILAENPEIDRSSAFELSKHMMDGQKWETFVLDLSFLGWNILSSITFGLVGIFYVNPYIESTNAELYAVLRENAISSSFTNSEELPGFEIRL